MPWVNGGDRIVNRAQTINVPLAKQIAAFNHLFHQLFKADALPFPFAAFTRALHRLKEPQRAIESLELRGAARAGGRAGIKSAFTRQLRHGG